MIPRKTCPDYTWFKDARTRNIFFQKTGAWDGLVIPASLKNSSQIILGLTLLLLRLFSYNAQKSK